MKIWRVTLLMFVVKTSWAQQAPSGEWASILISFKLNNRWTSVTDFGYRTTGRNFNAYQNYARTGLRYNINPIWSLAVGGALFNSKISPPEEATEYGHELRLWQDAYRTTPAADKWIVNHRWRLEEKFYQATSTRAAFNSLRFQYRLLGGYRMTNKWNFQLGPEWMENYASGKINFEQIRMYGILTYQSTKGYGVSAGYIYSIRKAYNQNIYTISFSKNVRRHVNHQQ